jgi:hypothetical protein
MGRSAINATRRIASTAGLSRSISVPLERDQLHFLKRYEESPQNRFLSCEALIMKRYWQCYDLAVRQERYGSRKKSRFVREHVMNPSGRARGYTAVDSAINYMHQRRLFKARQVNAELGLTSDSEGFLHRRRWNRKGLGLLLDLTDPFKFADREKLLQPILAHDLSWRDFYSTTDRHELRFYYPKPEAVVIMEKVSDEADRMSVDHDGKSETLVETYKHMVAKLAEALQQNKLSAALPFIYPAG